VAHTSLLVAVLSSTIAGTDTCLVNDLNQVNFVACYPGFDLDDPDWPALLQQVEDVGSLLIVVKARVTPSPAG
jgi:hypothetical protein